MAAAGPMLFHTGPSSVRNVEMAATAAAEAVPMLFNNVEMAAAGPSVFEPSTAESLHNV